MFRQQKYIFVVFMCIAASLLAGCHINWEQPGRCASAQDCPTDQTCNGLVCVAKQTGGTCRTSDDCGGRDCLAQKCVPSPTKEPNPTPDAGPKPDAPKPDTTPDITPDAGPDNTPDQTPPGPDNTPTSSACIAGSVKPCRQGCAKGIQRCLNGGIWSTCADGGPSHSGWYTPSEQKGERCGDNIDNNCNGTIDEGCFNNNKPQCQSAFQFSHSYKFSKYEPAFLDSQAYSPKQRLLLQRHNQHKSILSLYRVTPEQRQGQWMLDLPSVGEDIVTFDFGRDGRYIAVATSQKLIVWALKYDAKGGVTLAHFGVFATPHISALGITADSLVYFTRQQRGERESSLVNSRISIKPDGKLGLTQLAKLGIKNWYHARLAQPRLPIHPSGKYLVAYHYGSFQVYSLPDLKLLLEKPTGSSFDGSTPWFSFHPTSSGFAVAPFDYGRGALFVDLSLGPDGKPKGDLRVAQPLNYSVQAAGYEPKTGDYYVFIQGQGLAKWNDAKGGDTPAFTWVGDAAKAYDLSADGELLYVLGATGMLRIISLKDGQLKHTQSLALLKHNKKKIRTSSLRLKVSKDQKRLLAIVPWGAAIWDINQVGTRFTIQRRTILQPTEKGWEDYGFQATFSNDGRWLAIGNNRTIYIWKFERDGTPTPMPIITLTSGWCTALAFHGVGEPILMTGTYKGELKLWSMGSDRKSQTIHTFRSIHGTLQVSDIAFTTTGNKTYALVSTFGEMHAFNFIQVMPGSWLMEKLKGTVPQPPGLKNVREVTFQERGEVVLRLQDRAARMRLSFTTVNGQLTLSQDGIPEVVLMPKAAQAGFLYKVFFHAASKKFILLDDTRGFVSRCR